jgi:DNA-binding NtrC family response regulator
MSQKSVLIADDERMIREYFGAVLSSYDMEVVAVANGAEAWKQLEERRFDLVISDIQMPIMGGIELLRSIRERSPEQAVILITGAAPDEVVDEGTALGAFFLRKPMSVAEIEDAVEAILGVRKEPSPAAAA